MKAKINRVTIRLVQQNILSLDVDGLVNATDTELTLEPALSALAGAEVVREVESLAWAEVGSAVVTGGGASQFDKIIHAVGPRWGEGAERGKLLNVTLASLQLAEGNKLKSVTMPAISTGAMGYPLEACAKIMLTQIIDYTFEDIKHLRHVIVCLDNDMAYAVFKHEFQQQLQELQGDDDAKVQV